MKIGIVTPFYYPNMKGGSEVSAKLLAEKLVERGNEVTVLSFDLDAKVRNSEVINGVKVLRYKIYTKEALLLTLIPYVIRAMKKWESRVEIYHVYNVFPIAGAGLYKLLGGKKKVIATLNNYAAFCPIGTAVHGCKNCNLLKRFKCLTEQSKNKIVSVLYSSTYPSLTTVSKRLDGYIALSEIVKEYYAARGFDEKRIKVIPNFIQSDLKNSGFKKAENGTFNILYVGRISESKGISVLIRAFSRLASKHSEVRLILVGDGQNVGYYKGIVKNLGLDGKVVFTGRLNEEEKCLYYSKADVFVHPGIWPEPSGRTILEAMIFQVPLVVSNVGAPPRIVESAGLIFERGNAEDLEKKVEAIIADNELKKKLRLGCVETVKKYDPDQIVEKIIELYKKVLAI